MNSREAAEDFKLASDVLRKSITLKQIADECGVFVEALERAMLDESSEAYIPPPRFWKGDLAYVARERAMELLGLAEELEASAWAPATEEELEEIGSQILEQFDRIVRPEESEGGLEGKPADFDTQWTDIESRRADRTRPKAGKLAELKELLLRGLLR